MKPAAAGMILLMGVVVGEPIQAGAPQPASFSGNVVPLSDPSPRTWDGHGVEWPLPLTINVKSWTTADQVREAAAAQSAAGEKGVKALLLQATRGHVVPPGVAAVGVGMLGRGREPAWRIVLASSSDTQAGRRVWLVTDRPLYVLDYPPAHTDLQDAPLRLGAIELTLTSDGKGEGTIIPLAKVSFDQDGRVTVIPPPSGGASYKLVGVKAWER